MRKKRQYEFDLEKLTPEERLERVAELLAKGVIRLIEEGASGTEEEKTVCPEDEVMPPERGRTPFGLRKGRGGRLMVEAEIALIKRIKELADRDWSSERIARQLNEEDKTSRQAGRWSRVAVWRILKRIKEIGVTD